MRYGLIFLSIFFVFDCFGQNEKTEQPHGTLIFAMICSDGIIMASDSRMSFDDHSNNIDKTYAYFDRFKKIFSIGNFKIEMSGGSFIGNYFKGDLINRFNKASIKSNDISQTFNSFEKYISKNYGLDTGKIFENKSECILAGYKNAAPLLINLQTNNNFSQNKFKGFITNDDGFVPYMISHYRIASFTCNEMKTILDKVIYEYANYSGRIKIGGPLEIIQIKKDNSVIVLESFQSQNFINYKVFLNSIIDNKIPVTYLYPYSRTKVVAEAKSLLVK